MWQNDLRSRGTWFGLGCVALLFIFCLCLGVGAVPSGRGGGHKAHVSTSRDREPTWGKYPLVLACTEQRRVTGYLDLGSVRRVALWVQRLREWCLSPGPWPVDARTGWQVPGQAGVIRPGKPALLTTMKSRLEDSPSQEQISQSRKYLFAILI